MVPCRFSLNLSPAILEKCYNPLGQLPFNANYYPESLPVDLLKEFEEKKTLLVINYRDLPISLQDFFFFHMIIYQGETQCRLSWVFIHNWVITNGMLLVHNGPTNLNLIYNTPLQSIVLVRLLERTISSVKDVFEEILKILHRGIQVNHPKLILKWFWIFWILKFPPSSRLVLTMIHQVPLTSQPVSQVFLICSQEYCYRDMMYIAWFILIS